MKRLLMVGAGVSTVSLLKNLTKFKDLETLNIDIVDSQSQFGRGNAYIKDSTHLMSNVPVHEMALDDDPNHLADWLDDKGIDYDRFCSRESFGQYMHDVLTDIIERHENVRYKYGTIDKIDYEGKVYRTSLGGKIIEYDYVYLGIGMLEYADPYELKGMPNFIYNAYPLTENLKDIDGKVAVIGSGLSGIDCVRYLLIERKLDRVYMFSRDKEMPAVRGKSHTFDFKYLTHEALDLRVNDNKLNLEDVKELFLKEVRHHDIDLSLFERKTGRIIEDLTYDLEHQKSVGKLEYFLIEFNKIFTHYLHKLSVDDQAYMMEHYHPYIDENYSPMPAAVAEDIVEWLLASKLIMVENLEGIEHNNHFILKTEDATYDMDVVINATGPHNDIESSSNPLIKHLLSQELIKPHHLGGFEIDAHYHVISPKHGVQKQMFALGELTFGMTYLSTAVFDIYEMTKDIAQEIKDVV